MARDFLGLKAAQFHIPLVEGGFRGPRASCTILLNDRPDAPCWHCNIYDRTNRQVAVQLGCTQVARKAEEAGFVPAIQTTASYLASFMSEEAVQLLHENKELANKRILMNIRTAASSVVRLQFNPKCPFHAVSRTIEFQLSLPKHATCRDMIAELKERMRRPVVQLPFSFLVRVGCAQCKHPISVNQPEWIMTSLLFCTECGGPWPRSDERGNEIYTTLSSDTEPLLDLPAEHVGLVAGSLIEATSNGAHVRFGLHCKSTFPFFCEAKENRDDIRVRS
jgi:hypothetical protein